MPHQFSLLLRVYLFLFALQGIMEGNGLPDIRTKDQMLKCVRDSGMELLDARDVDDGSSDFPWYNTLASTFSVRGFTYSAVGRWTTGAFFFSLLFVCVLTCSVFVSRSACPCVGSYPPGTQGHL